MVNRRKAKLEMRERVSRSADTGWQCGQLTHSCCWVKSVKLRKRLICTVCCLLLVLGRVDGESIDIVTMVSRGDTLGLNREKLSILLYKVTLQGFIWDMDLSRETWTLMKLKLRTLWLHSILYFWWLFFFSKKLGEPKGNYFSFSAKQISMINH